MLTEMVSTRPGRRHRLTGIGRRIAGGLMATAGLALACGLSIVPVGADSSPDADAMIADALRAAPAGIRDSAVVSDLKGNVLRAGTSDYTCFPAPEGVAGPMCMDAEWRRWMAAWMEGKPFAAQHVGIAYMLAGDTPGGGASNIDPAATEPTADNDWVVEGPHIMVITPDPAAFAGLPRTPETDGPYVMWADTPYVHLMVPVAERPQQRTVASQ